MHVDCHSHLGDLTDDKAAEFWKKNHRVPDWVAQPYLEAMQGVDRAIVLAHWGPLSINSNEVVAYFTHENPKLVPFYNIDPRTPTVIDDLHRLALEMGGKGIKLGPIYQGFQPDDEAYFPVYEKIQALHLPILWHQGSSFDARMGPLEWASPVLLDKIARTFPDLKMIVAHLGFPWVRETIALVRKQPNVYTDISGLRLRTWLLYNALVELIQYGGEDKIFFGTDFPWFTPAQVREGLQEAAAFAKGSNLPQLPDEVIEGIVHRNTLQILEIE
jgi:predicted TIM-barrel fold metal-dependent hydrolase